MKKLIALLLALVMVIAMTACGAAKPTETEAPKADTPKETEAPKQTEAPVETEAPKEEPVKITIGVGKKDTVEDYDTNAMTLLVEEACNVEIEWVFFSSDKTEMGTQIGLMVSNNEELPDIIFHSPTGNNSDFHNEYGNMGYFVDLTEYLNDPEKTPYFHDSLASCTEGSFEFLKQMSTSPIDGKWYHWPTYIEATWNMIGHHVQINQEWLDEVGMEIPKTPDEFYTVLKAFKEKHPDGVPAIGTTSYRSNLIEWICNAYIYNYVDYYWNVEDGKLYSPYRTDEYREGLIFCKKLCDEGLIDPLTFTSTKPADLMAYVTPTGEENAKCGLFSSHVELAAEVGHEALFDFVPIIALDSGNGKGGNVIWRTHSYENGAGITTFCENVDKAVEVLDFLASKEMTITSQKGIRGTHWDWVAPGTGTTAIGYDATYDCWDNTIWQNQTNYIWNISACSIFSLEGTARMVVDDGSFSYKRQMIVMDKFTQSQEAKTPDEVVKELIYTAEENEVVTNCKKLLQGFVKSEAALFATGAKDPADDAVWAEYIAALDAQGENDWLAVAQSAYTRMNG